tara:strand:+ start:366 stop:884 length:519 start_codon:yes stop_codon:yes gene_type:complete
MEIIDFQKHLEKLNYSCHFRPQLNNGQNDFKIDVLSIGLDQLLLDQYDSDPFIELCFVPGMEEKLKKTQLLQYFVGLPFKGFSMISEAIMLDVKDLLLHVNFTLHSGHFGMNLDGNYLYYKHSEIIEDNNGKSEFNSLVDTIELINFNIYTFERAFYEVISEQKTLKELINA